jgi:hypothetical protein
MSWDQIARRWRVDLVNKLQDRYGLPEKEARKKAETWLDWLKEQSGLKPAAGCEASEADTAAAGHAAPSPRSRVPAGNAPGKSRSSIQKSRSIASL